MVMQTVSPQELKQHLHGTRELALLDVREQGDYGQEHLLFAINTPLSRLELCVPTLVPRKDVLLVCCDAQGEVQGFAFRAAAKLKAMGYGRVCVLEKGMAAWKDAGFHVYSGMHTVSKAFGEFVEHAYSTPNLSAEELSAMQKKGENVLVLDSRPYSEYITMSIPEAVNTPGAELVLRVHDMAPSPETAVVVNCAGRTRSILGAQSLINAGIPNRVFALQNGTMGWHLSGLRLEHGMTRRAPQASAAGLKKAQICAQRVADNYHLKTVVWQRAQEWLHNKQRTTFLLDVRTPEEFSTSHIKGSINAPGGQLVQATDGYIGVKNARVVLVDDSRVRARLTAHWLVQMGWKDVYVLEEGLDPLPNTQKEGGTAPPLETGLDAFNTHVLSTADTALLCKKKEAVVVDFASSLAYKDAHIPGAWFCVRSDLLQAIRHLPQNKHLVFTCPNGDVARLAAPEAIALGATVSVLKGGTAAWIAEGRPMENGMTQQASFVRDVFLRPYDRDERIEEAMQEYLHWEVDLVAQIKADGDAQFELKPTN